ncbi:arabinogalactan protein 41-like [Neltuma alba]|uniref:arabinogalactan protein 41-like n=1 Tax=Neltuma alba TaxID=207710 RepID=UPI0010A48083|nr:arabinogalactan protein 41-like [Prosopis alba]XP_028791946.1 arabinogalactan protein 41-like [Prosopis alba]
MAFFKSCAGIVAISALVFTIFMPFIVQGQSFPPAPSPAPGPSSDGTTIDQGIAYVLMFVALVLTYLIHPLDAFSH